MNMNRDAVNIALSLAGNQPLTDEDKQYNNSVYRMCRQNYLPVLFNSLCEIDWRCARKFGELNLSSDFSQPHESGKWYYNIPADCLRPLLVDDNSENFRQDERYIITDEPARQLYYVFHKRNLKHNIFKAPEDAENRDNRIIIRRPTGQEALNARGQFVRPRSAVPNIPATDDEFPEWEWTPYDADFWGYFSYKFAAALIPKLRADDGAAQRAQAMEMIARQKGEETIQRSKAAGTNPHGRYESWLEKCGLSPDWVGYGRRQEVRYRPKEWER